MHSYGTSASVMAGQCFENDFEISTSNTAVKQNHVQCKDHLESLTRGNSSPTTNMK